MFTLLHEAQMGSEPDPEVRSLGEALGGLQLEPLRPRQVILLQTQAAHPISVATHHLLQLRAQRSLLVRQMLVSLSDFTLFGRYLTIDLL